MRINKYIALKTGISRRSADAAIADGRVLLNGQPPVAGQQVSETDVLTLDGRPIAQDVSITTIMLNKPVGYVCSRDGQGSQTIYDLLPPEMHRLKPVGRLDKHSSGLILLTNDGHLAQELTHPKFHKLKKYKIALNKDLTDADHAKICKVGVELDDGPSKLALEPMNNQKKEWKVVMSEGRNRQIRRTFEHLGYTVVKLHRTHFGPYVLGSLTSGKFDKIRI